MGNYFFFFYEHNDTKNIFYTRQRITVLKINCRSEPQITDFKLFEIKKKNSIFNTVYYILIIRIIFFSGLIFFYLSLGY